MPFKSKAQAKALWAKNPKVAQEFADATPNIKALPEHVKKKKTKSKKGK
jgi:hypothetical protein